jgi:hypothetical protein
MHSCPDCGQACYCGGDIDDIEVDPTAEDRCAHCEDDNGDDAAAADFDPFDDKPDPLDPSITIRTEADLTSND